MASTSTIKAGKAEVELDLNTKQFEKQLNRITHDIDAFGKNLQKRGAQIAGFSAALGAPLVLAGKRTLELGDKFHKMSLRTKVAVEDLSALAFAAEQSGTNIDQVGNVLFRMNRRIANAKTGTGPAARALKELGVNIQDLNQQSTLEQFFTMINALMGMEDQARASQLAFEIFGDEWKQISVLVREGEAGIRSLMQELRELGGEMSGETAQAAADAGDELNRLNKQFDRLVFTVGVPALQALRPFSEILKDIIPQMSEFVGENKELVQVMGVAVIGLGAFGAALIALGTAARTAGAGFAFMAKHRRAALAVGGLTLLGGTGEENFDRGMLDALTFGALVPEKVGSRPDAGFRNAIERALAAGGVDARLAGPVPVRQEDVQNLGQGLMQLAGAVKDSIPFIFNEKVARDFEALPREVVQQAQNATTQAIQQSGFFGFGRAGQDTQMKQLNVQERMLNELVGLNRKANGNNIEGVALG